MITLLSEHVANHRMQGECAVTKEEDLKEFFEIFDPLVKMFGNDIGHMFQEENTYLVSIQFVRIGST